MKYLTIIYFFVLFFSLGYSLRSLFKIELKRFWEDILLNMGLGLSVFPLISILFNSIGIPLRWHLFLSLALLVPALDLIKKRNFLFVKEKSYIFGGISIFLIVALVFSVHLFVFLEGSNAYPYLEDGDPWVHAEVADYISITGTYSLAKEDQKILHYTEPYPPFYAVLNGILHQIEPDLMWVLKFFNSLIISLSLFFFFLLSKAIFKNEGVALFSTFLLATIPSYLSHFIFSTGYAVALFFPALYVLLTEQENQGWKTILFCSLIISGVFLVQPIASAMFLLLAVIILIFKYLVKDNWKGYSLSLMGGLFLSQLYWIPTFIKFGFDGVAEKIGFGILEGGAGDSSGGVIYSLMDYMFSPFANKIDQATGFGWMIFILLVVGIIIVLFKYKKLLKNKQHLILAFLVYCAITFLLTESNAFPYKLTPHRIWVYLSISVAIIGAFAFSVLWRSINKKVLKYAVLFLVLFFVLYSSAYPKYVVQTAQWPPGAFWQSGEELSGYLWMKDNLAPGTAVLIACSTFEGKISGMNLEERSWESEVRAFKRDYHLKEPKEMHYFLYNHNYSYLVFDGWCARNETTVDQTNSVIQKLVKEDGLFKLTHSTNEFVLFKVI
ncbi:hypothetical protein COY27_01500 [Candidatus Woesearchaeota archaeon CG_4_10_14_0_2_um_filter_33_13]|nr:MAG: hypothetical protein COY27_01500 [Candidatus Woesearchaeota archaeon CG_4_10_14_0_2_um_filter_33_13]